MEFSSVESVSSLTQLLILVCDGLVDFQPYKVRGERHLSLGQGCFHQTTATTLSLPFTRSVTVLTDAVNRG